MGRELQLAMTSFQHNEAKGKLERASPVVSSCLQVQQMKTTTTTMDYCCIIQIDIAITNAKTGSLIACAMNHKDIGHNMAHGSAGFVWIILLYPRAQDWFMLKTRNGNCFVFSR